MWIQKFILMRTLLKPHIETHLYNLPTNKDQCILGVKIYSICYNFPFVGMCYYIPI